MIVTVEKLMKATPELVSSKAVRLLSQGMTRDQMLMLVDLLRDGAWVEDLTDRLDMWLEMQER